MENQQIEALLKEELGLAEVHVTSDGSHFQIIAVSDQFDGMSRVKKAAVCIQAVVGKNSRRQHARVINQNLF